MPDISFADLKLFFADNEPRPQVGYDYQWDEDLVNAIIYINKNRQKSGDF